MLRWKYGVKELMDKSKSKEVKISNKAETGRKRKQ